MPRFTIHDLAVKTTAYFRERPLPDEDGLPVDVPEWCFQSAGSILTKIEVRDRVQAVIFAYDTGLVRPA